MTQRDFIFLLLLVSLILLVALVSGSVLHAKNSQYIEVGEVTINPNLK